MKKLRSKRGEPSKAPIEKKAAEAQERLAVEQMPMMSEELWPALAGVLGLETNIRLRSATIKLEIGKPVVVTVTQEAVSGE